MPFSVWPLCTPVLLSLVSYYVGLEANPLGKLYDYSKFLHSLLSANALRALLAELVVLCLLSCGSNPVLLFQDGTEGRGGHWLQLCWLGVSACPVFLCLEKVVLEYFCKKEKIMRRQLVVLYIVTYRGIMLQAFQGGFRSSTQTVVPHYETFLAESCLHSTWILHARVWTVLILLFKQTCLLEMPLTHYTAGFIVECRQHYAFCWWYEHLALSTFAFSVEWTLNALLQCLIIPWCKCLVAQACIVDRSLVLVPCSGILVQAGEGW